MQPTSKRSLEQLGEILGALAGYTLFTTLLYVVRLYDGHGH